MHTEDDCRLTDKRACEPVDLRPGVQSPLYRPVCRKGWSVPRQFPTGFQICSPKKPTCPCKEPDSTDKESDSTDKEPDSTDKEPDSTDKEPDSTDKEPDSTDKEPDSTDKEPDSADKESDSTRRLLRGFKPTRTLGSLPNRFV
ncbi:hypothetical protein FACS1894137_07570 [Spirochaetia bacterium]|nr:hypothetical protein FACS1894137_07570 [Spirochaetia bacterium]